MFSILTPSNKELLRRTKIFRFLIYNRKIFSFPYLGIKSKQQELRGHKDVTVNSHEFDLIFLFTKNFFCLYLYKNESITSNSKVYCRHYLNLVFFNNISSNLKPFEENKNTIKTRGAARSQICTSSVV